MSVKLPEISKQIWTDKYQYKDNNTGSVYDKNITYTWKRIAKTLASVEEDELLYNDFYYALTDFKFIPAGRIIAGAGTDRNVTLHNCYVMGNIHDSMGGIFDALKEAALTMQAGGGIGYDFSTIRPKGSEVKGVGSDASGPLTFMDTWDAMCRTVMSAGSRRGAMMATMRCDHPDIFDFIHAKKDPLKLRMFNLSVLVTDDFMRRVKNNLTFELKFNGRVHEVIEARDLWDAIMTSTYNYAEPGVIFIDRINDLNNLSNIETISATNPCGEQPLPPYGSCLLGSINLTQFVNNPFEPDNCYINYNKLEKVVKTAVRMLDNVVDISKYPLEKQEYEAKQKRRIGLGITGLASMFAMLCTKYGSTRSIVVVKELMNVICTTAYETSIALGKEKEPFLYLSNTDTLMKNVSTELSFAETKGYNQPRRNSHLLSIAPTGTISLLAKNVSSGIEPIFAYGFNRDILNPDGSKRTEKVEDYAVSLYKQKFNVESYDELPDYFTTAQDLSVKAHVEMQAAVQEYVDTSISKTINIPKDYPYDDFKKVYLQAYESGCKGCTTYRPNEVTGSILSVEEEKEEEKPVVTNVVTVIDRPNSLKGTTYKVKWPANEEKMYITINDYIENGETRPFEIFINSKNVEHQAWIAALTRMISAIFRRGGDMYFITEELKSVFDPRGGAWIDGVYIPSIIALIGDVIAQHLSQDNEVKPTKKETESQKIDMKLCSKCNTHNVTMKDNCEVCLNCGDSKCA